MSEVAARAPTPPSRRRRLAGAALLIVLAGLLFGLELGDYPLWDPDEVRHAEVAREMFMGQGLQRFFCPTLEFHPYREKPAGYYWLVALAYSAAGVGAGAARAVSALAALATVLALYVYALPRLGFEGALVSGLVAATSVGYFALARYVILDMTLTTCVTVGVLGGLAWIERPTPRRPPLLPYVAAAGGTLVKGPLAGVLVAGPLLIAAWLHRPRPTLREMGLGRGLAVAALIIAALYVPAAALDPDFPRYLVQTHLRRFASDAPHRAPVYYYLVWLPTMLLPWTIFAVPAVMRAVRVPERRALVAWAAFVPALMTLARGKLATYVLPALPPLALLAAPTIARRDPLPEDVPWMIGGAYACVALLFGVAAAALLPARLLALGLPARALLLGTAILGAAALVVAVRRQALAYLPRIVLGAIVAVYLLGTHYVLPAVSVLHSDRDAAARVVAAGGGTVIAFKVHDHSLTFYTGAPVVRTADPNLVQRLFASDAPTFLVTSYHHFDQIEQLLGSRAYLWHATARRRLYGNRPPPESSSAPEGVTIGSARTQLLGDREQAIVLGGALGAAGGARLDLPRATGHRQISDEGIFGLARAVRDDRAISRLRGARHGRARLAQRADLIDLDQDGVADTVGDAACEQLFVGDEDVVADDLYPRAEPRREPLPARPVVLAEAVLDRDDGIALAPAFVEIDQLVGGSARAAGLAKDVSIAVDQLARGAVERQ
jgi:4-amino-4-deoxy-L-arabinose transferase-like glycosyltransferase